MPKDRRSSTARADTRPAFARPPGARAPPPEPSPPRPARKKHRRDEEFSDDQYDSIPRRSTPKRAPKEKARASPATSPTKRPPGRDRHKRKTSEPPTSYDSGDRDRAKYSSGASANSASQLLSTNALAKLNEENDLDEFERKRKARKRKEKAYKNIETVEASEKKRRRKNRDVSGAILEEGRGTKRRRGHSKSYDDYYEEKRYAKKAAPPRKKKWWIIGGVAIVALIIIIVAAVVASNNSKKKSGGGSSNSAVSTNTTATAQNTCKNADVPAAAKGTYTDVTTWLDTTDFNCTWTNETVGGLSVMGLNSTWDDSTRANSGTQPLNKPWSYGTVPIRGMNVGGWFSLEPFITPSLFNYPSSAGVVDEWTLSQKLGAQAASTIEEHYATFITRADFEAIKAAGMDHVRIPYSYWAVKTYEGDPYVPQIAWRYLLRAIEWARQCGLRVNLDLHGVPGSQNGWAHSGHQGSIGWLNGNDGDTNGDRSVDIHNQLSQFFAQDRYANVVTMYGLVNEPRMIQMDDPDRVLTWNKQVIQLARQNGIKQIIVFGDGFYPLTYWNDTFKNVDPNLMLDTHQYQIFDAGQLSLTHQNKINLACSGWTGIMTASNNNVTGWGPTLNGEFSQADTDCTPNLNNVGVGTRWAGTFNPNNGLAAVTTPSCPSTPDCSCNLANADPSTYTDAYKQMLQMYAEAQMNSFEKAQGWFYWTWKTESSVQWSWKLGLQAGILPALASKPSFTCDAAVPDFSGLPESY